MAPQAPACAGAHPLPSPSPIKGEGLKSMVATVPPSLLVAPVSARRRTSSIWWTILGNPDASPEAPGHQCLIHITHGRLSRVS